MSNPKTNCRHCGRPVWGDGSYCSRTCENEDLPDAMAEGCGRIVGYMIVGVILWGLIFALFAFDPMGLF